MKPPEKRFSSARIDVAVGQLKVRCEAIAKEQGVSLSDWVREVLADACDRHRSG